MIGVLAAIALAVGLTGEGRRAAEEQPRLVAEDPDDDIVRHRSRRTVGRRVVRDVTSAALWDALPRATARTGERVASVQPSDGRLRAAGATAAATAG